MKVNFVIFFSLLLYNITTIISDCQFVSLFHKESTTLKVQSPSQYCIHFDITSMPLGEEGILTFHISHGILMNNHIKSFNTRAIHISKSTSLLEKHFPIEKEPNVLYFPIETAYENTYDNSLHTVNHIYFFKENTDDDGTLQTYLLIYLDIDIQSTDSNSYYEIKILAPIFTNNIVSTDLAGEKPIQLTGGGFALYPKIPTYMRLYYSDKVIKNNYLFFSKGKYFTYTCGSFLLKTTNAYVINPNRHYGYFVDFNSLNTNSRVCNSLFIKFIISDSSDYSIQYQIERLTFPFVNLPVFDMYQNSYSVNVEINDIDMQYDLLGVFPKEKVTESKVYILSTFFFGLGDVIYKTSDKLKDIHELYLSGNPEYIHYSNSSFLLELANTDYELNIFHVKCETNCLIHFEIFDVFNDNIEEEKNEYRLDLEYPGVYFFRLNQNTNFFLYFINLQRFSYELENLNGENIEGEIEFGKFVLNLQNKIKQDLIDYSGYDETFSVKMVLKSTMNNALMKLKINYWEDIEEIKINTHSIHNIGNYKYTFKTFLFKFPLDDKIYDSYQIQILSKDDSNPNIKFPISLYSYFDLGYQDHFILPSAYNSHIDYLSEPSYKFTADISNPYDRSYSIIPKSNDKMFYYYAVRFHNYDKESNVFIAFTGAEKPNYTYLTENSLTIVDIQGRNDNNYLLTKGGKYRDSSLIVNFFKCDNNVNDISFQIMQLNNKVVLSDKISDNNQRNISKDIGIDYIIKFNSNDNLKLIIYYAYQLNSNLLSLTESDDSSINYKLTSDLKTNNLFLQFKPYYITGGKISYFIYLIPFDEGIKDKCSFMSRSPLISLLHFNNDGTDIDAFIFDIEPGNYWIQVVAQEAYNVHSFKIYDRVFITVKAHSYIILFLIKTLITTLSIMSLLMILFIFKTKGNIFNNLKRKHLNKYNTRNENKNSRQLEEK